MTVKAADILVTIEADDTALKEEIARFLERDINARVEYSTLYGKAPKPGSLPPISHTYTRNGRTVVEVDAIYVVGQGYVYV